MDSLEKSKLGVDLIAAVRVELEFPQPRQAGNGEEGADGQGNQPLVKDGMDTVLDPGTVTDERGPMTGHLAQQPGLRVRDPDLGEVVDTEQLRQHEGIDLVGLDLGLGDGLGAQRIGDDDLADEGLQDLDDGPGIGGRLECQLVLGRKETFGEVQQLVPGTVEPVAMDQFAVLVDDGGFDDFLVDIQSDEEHEIILLVREGRASLVQGRANRVLSGGWDRWPSRPLDDPADAKKRVNRHLPIRARGSTGWAVGRSNTTACSKHIRVTDRPRGDRPSRTTLEEASHLVPYPVRERRAQVSGC